MTSSTAPNGIEDTASTTPLHMPAEEEFLAGKINIAEYVDRTRETACRLVEHDRPKMVAEQAKIDRRLRRIQLAGALMAIAVTLGYLVLGAAVLTARLNSTIGWLSVILALLCLTLAVRLLRSFVSRVR